MASKGEGRTSGAAAAPSLGNALVVEDDGLLAMAIAETLADGGCAKVVVCASITAAMGELERLRPDIMVLDVHLADRDDGWALAELALQLSPRPPLIVFSTGAPESIPPAIAALGHVLVKPYRAERIIELAQARRGRAGLLSRLRGALSI